VTHDKQLLSNLIILIQFSSTYTLVTTTSCGRSCIERQFIIVSTRKDRKRKAAANTPSPEPNPKKPKQQLPPEPKTGTRPTVCRVISGGQFRVEALRVCLARLGVARCRSSGRTFSLASRSIDNHSPFTSPKSLYLSL